MTRLSLSWKSLKNALWGWTRRNKGAPVPHPTPLPKDPQRASEAVSRLLTDPVFNHCVEDLKSSYIQAFFSSKPEQVEERERIYLMYGSLEALVAKIDALYRAASAAALMNERNEPSGSATPEDVDV